MKPTPALRLACAAILVTLLSGAGLGAPEPERRKYVVVDTGQVTCHDERRATTFPERGERFFGQDAQYAGNAPAYRDNGDGTITDLHTGLMWEKTPDFVTRTWVDAGKHAKALKLAGHADWRLPTIKELFSIADFRGNMRTRTPYIDTRVFDFVYPDPATGARDMDAQYWSSNLYLGTTMFGDRSAFGFNFADGRIKSYPVDGGREGGRGPGPGPGRDSHRNRKYVRCVRGPAYGENDFADNWDHTVTDRATGLTWTKSDSGKPMTWEQALAYAEGLEFAGKSDWRLPNVKELQSIVDYSRAPDRAPDARPASARGPAIDPVFDLTKTESWFWSSTTHLENRFGYYVCFGQAFSAWVRDGKQINAHGAGAVRSDPKSGDPADFAEGHGPQGDEVRILNYVRCVRGGKADHVKAPPGYEPPADEGPRNRPEGPPGGGSPGKRFVQRLDKDGDGKVSLEEFDGPDHHFPRLDRNGDGFLSEDEAPRGPPRKR